MAERKYKKASKGRKPQKLSKAAMDAFKKAKQPTWNKATSSGSVVNQKEMRKVFKKYGKYKAPKAKVATAIAKRSLGRAVGSIIPGVGAALTAYEVGKYGYKKIKESQKGSPMKGKSCGPGSSKVMRGGKAYCVKKRVKAKPGLKAKPKA